MCFFFFFCQTLSYITGKEFHLVVNTELGVGVKKSGIGGARSVLSGRSYDKAGAGMWST